MRPETNEFFSLCSTPDMKRSRQSPLTPSVPIPYHNSQLEGALANLAVFMPRSQDNGQMVRRTFVKDLIVTRKFSSHNKYPLELY